MHGLCSNSAHVCAPEKGGVAQIILIFVPFVEDPQECRGHRAFPPTCGPEKAGISKPLLTLFPTLGTPENTAVTYHFRTLVGHVEGTRQTAK